MVSGMDIVPERVLPSKRLMGMCRCMGSQIFESLRLKKFLYLGLTHTKKSEFMSG